MAFETTTERIFKDRVTVFTKDLQYCEYGIDFIRFRCPDTGKLFEIKCKEIKQKIKEL
jgi:hypothetical protein